MFSADDATDSSSDDVPISHLKQVLDNSFNTENVLAPWSQIADQFKCLTINFQFPETVQFLESLLTFIRKGPKDCRKFVNCIGKYLLATRNLVSKEDVDESYYDRIRQVLVLYCVLKLRLINCFEDDSTVASDVLLKIILLMQGSTSITVMDVLIDIDEQIQTARSISIMKIVNRSYLKKTLLAGPKVLDDTDFVKHLILFRSWYCAEIKAEKINVFKLFMSTIKPSHQLRSNPSYSILHIYNADEVDDYKKLLLQPFPRHALVRALRDADVQNDCHSESETMTLHDLTINEETVIKVEADRFLNLPNETIIVDDDLDPMTVSYLPKLFERFDVINLCQERLAIRNNAPTDTVDLVCSDSDSENAEKGTNDDASVHDHDSVDDSTRSLDIHLSKTKLKTYARNRNTQLKSKKNQHRRKSFPVKTAHHITTQPQPILRSPSCTVTPLVRSKRVTFKNPLVKQYLYEICDYDDADTNVNSDASSSGSSSSSTVTSGPQCNSPTCASSRTSAISSTHTDIEIVPNEIPLVKSRKLRKRRRSHFSNVNPKNSRTSIDNWIKRKKLTVMNEPTAESEVASESIVKLKNFSIFLSRFDDPMTGPSAKSGRTNEHSQRVERLDEDMTLKRIVEAKERLPSDSDACISTESVSTETVKTGRAEFKSSKSKPVIRQIKRKFTKAKTPLLSKNNLATESNECFISLERLKGIPSELKVFKRKRSQRLKDVERAKSILSNNTICQFPIKSPLEYHLKRSLKKMTPIKKTSTVQDQELELESFTQLEPSDTSNDPSDHQSIQVGLNSTSSELEVTVPANILNYSSDSALPSSELVVTSPTNVLQDVCFNKSPESNQEKSMISPPSQASSPSEVDGRRALTNNNCKMKTFEVTSAGTTTTEEIARGRDDTGLSSITCNINLEKPLQTAGDDCDNDIPSPVYSPHTSDEKNRSKPKIGLNCPSLIMHKSTNDADAITPIDMKVTNGDSTGDDGSDISNRTNLTICSSQHILSSMAEELNPVSLQQVDDIAGETLTKLQNKFPV